MPRLSPRSLRQAWHINSLLPLLLRQCRDLSSAKNELRWITEHMHNNSDTKCQHDAILSACKKRAGGWPLQYLLGSQPFGDLNILCQRGVLIPRPETETYTAHLAEFVKRELRVPQQSLRILDLCTGTGAIPLMLYSLLASQFRDLDIVGVDISAQAIRLAKENIKHNQEVLPPHSANHITFQGADILSSEFLERFNGREMKDNWDVMISNPPYISTESYWKDTSRSTRLYEPLIALVPLTQIPSHLDMCHLQPEDVFYSSIVAAAQLSSPTCLLMEVADLRQAQRVVRHVHHKKIFAAIEIWRDWPMDDVFEEVHEGDLVYRIRGSGHGRSVFCRL